VVSARSAGWLAQRLNAFLHRKRFVNAVGDPLDSPAGAAADTPTAEATPSRPATMSGARSASPPSSPEPGEIAARD